MNFSEEQLHKIAKIENQDESKDQEGVLLTRLGIWSDKPDEEHSIPKILQNARFMLLLFPSNQL